MWEASPTSALRLALTEGDSGSRPAQLRTFAIRPSSRELCLVAERERELFPPNATAPTHPDRTNLASGRRTPQCATCPRIGAGVDGNEADEHRFCNPPGSSRHRAQTADAWFIAQAEVSIRLPLADERGHDGAVTSIGVEE